jgi:hypothetical protein
MTTNSTQPILLGADDDGFEVGAHLREEVRQSLSNALDMVSITGDFWNGWPSIAVHAPLDLGAHRFMSVAGGIAAHVETLSLPRWRVTIAFQPTATDWGAYIVLNPSGLFPPDINETVDFLGHLGISPED